MHLMTFLLFMSIASSSALRAADVASDPVLEAAQAKLADLKKELADKSPQPRMARLIREGDFLYRQGEYASSFFTIIEGEVSLEDDGVTRTLERGQFFGESSLISGRPRNDSAKAGAGSKVTVTGCTSPNAG